MKVQLTKTKTIDIKFPSFGGGNKALSDLTGVELFPDGDSLSTEKLLCRAVRIFRKKNEWQLLSAKEITPPDGELPSKWDELSYQPTWELPREFQAPHAAIAVNSIDASFGQASKDAIIREMVQGLAANSDQPSQKDENQPRFKIKRAEQNPAATQPKEGGKLPPMPEAGDPVAEGGRRFVVQPFAEEGFHLRSSLPEYQVLWLSRLLPEGKRPTAASVQVADSSLMASVLAQPFFKESNGNALVVFVRANDVYFAGYRNGVPVLWRKCPGSKGELAMRKAVRNTLGVEEDLVDAVLEDSLVDPRPALEPFIHPILDQLELSRAYMAGKFDMDVDRAFIFGLSSGANHWMRYAEETIRLNLAAPDPFDGLSKAKGVNVVKPHLYLTALGAALAAGEVTK